MPMPEQKPGRSKQNYGTPKNFLDALKSKLGITKFTFDFACDEQNVKAERGWTEADNSLVQPLSLWVARSAGGWGWLNPPYADIEPWVIKCLLASQKGAKIALLVPASVGSNWYRDFIHREHGVQTLLLNGRLCFIENWRETINPKTGTFYTSEPLYPKDCICVLFGTGEAYRADVWTWK